MTEFINRKWDTSYEYDPARERSCFLGGGGSSGGTTTTTQKADPWSGIQSQLLQAVGDTQKLYNQSGNTGGTPDVGAYQKALSDYNTANPNGSKMTADQFAQAAGINNPNSYQKYLQGQPVRDIQGNLIPAANSSHPPTQDQFMTPGTGTGTGNPLSPNFFPGNTVAQFAPQQQQAIDLTTQRALNGSPVNQANNSMLTNTLNGNYLDPNSNPYLKGTYDQAAQAVQGSVNGAFGQGGRYGSGLNQDTLEKNLNNLATNIYGTNYTNERNNQLKAGLEAPGAANQDYTDLGALATTGAQVQGQNQANIGDAMARYNYTTGQPMQQIQNYLGLLNGTGVGNTQTQTSPYYQNNSANALGMGLGLLGGANAIGGLTSGSGLLSASSMPALAAFFSDIRLKENIEYIGHEKGIPVYDFNYRNDETKARYRGVMAQDIIETHPEAVHEFNGVYMVDYSKLGIEFKKISNPIH